jgi:hypothetical protein
MAERIHTFSSHVTGPGGERYRVHAEGARHELGTWDGWLVYEPGGRGGPALRTGCETTQPDRGALLYWVGGLEPVYLDGGLARARAG